MKDYKKTLNLPNTDFPMRANLPKREPEFLKEWDSLNLYDKLIEKSKNSPQYILHDGPPYANGDIHLGHALNKTLKDIVVRYKFLRGFSASFIPGWDCHGLPVEHQLIQKLNLKKAEIDPLDFRKKARDYALEYVEIQKGQFKRLGSLGDWGNPYLTLDFKYEAAILKSLAELMDQGYLYKDVKPVNWCIQCETALAEAEVEYEEHTSDSIYVKFKLNGESKLKEKYNLSEDVYFLIWTTTPWTLISNVAVAVAPDEDYVLLKVASGNTLLLADKMKKFSEENLGIKIVKEIAKLKGIELEDEVLNHPFLERQSKVVTAGFVSMEEGTGCVHIAPGHGMDDYLLSREKNLELIMPLNNKGIFEDAGEFSGLLVWDANEKVKEILRTKEALLKESQIQHSYPHCWRCKTPIIFRATLQLFMSIDKAGLREKLLQAAGSVKWFPNLGLQRIKAMLQTRPDWCLSRQRYWGVGIPSVRCILCGKSILDKNLVLNVAQKVSKEGSDVWFKEDCSMFLPVGFKCPQCENKNPDAFEKENDIIDVWFESGISHQAVLNEDYGLKYPADLYLEGSDQHRGWFQTSLITGISIKEIPPYKNVLTHGFVVDGNGKKMSKSQGNVISPFEIVDKYGADVLRLWVVSRDFTQDLRVSEEIISQVVDAYRKIRNTFRFLISNIYDFAPHEAVKYQDLDFIDKWMYNEINLLVKDVIGCYEGYDFHSVFKKVYLFMNETLSSVYLDILKDRMYTFSPCDVKRKSSQTVLYRLSIVLAKLVGPILPFTADDVWKSIKNKIDKDAQYKSVQLSFLDEEEFSEIDDRILKDFNSLLEIRSLVMKVIESKREAHELGSSLEAKVILKIALDKTYQFLDNYKAILHTLFIVSVVELERIKDTVQLETGKDMIIEVEKSKGVKCARCWNYTDDVGSSTEFADVCARCVDVLRSF
ncbi:MAG: isoleucine--tRNA ligase [Candidatus Saelkia tenebricola]|nr:isoleucine--tRNA ligase [Candidatus Saelkia tenebricola]